MVDQPTRRRPLGQTRARQAAQRFTGRREASAAALAHAERWLQALRTWERVETDVLMRVSLGSSSGGRFRVIAGNWASQGGGSSTVQLWLVRVPTGHVEEARLGHLCSANWHLSELRRGAGLATLVHASGRGWAGQRAREYGAALLTLAGQLGDTEAQNLSVDGLSFAED